MYGDMNSIRSQQWQKDETESYILLTDIIQSSSTVYACYKYRHGPKGNYVFKDVIDTFPASAIKRVNDISKTAHDDSPY